ncbi:MAG: hypothetical protein WDN46_22520 [Methylocella sp.]
MNISKLLFVAALVAGSASFAEAKQASPYSYDRQYAQEESIVMGRSVGAEMQNTSHSAVEQLRPARGPFEIY